MKLPRQNSRRQAVSKVSLDADKPRSRRTRDRAGKKQALILAALKLFANKGYDATTTREIAASAGCAEGLIHRYFNGKAGLLPALMEFRVSQEVADLMHHIPSAHTFEDEYLQLVDWALEHMWQDREFLRVAIPRALSGSRLWASVASGRSAPEGARDRLAPEEIQGMPGACPMPSSMRWSSR